MPSKHAIKFTLRENVAIRLQETKGCGSWSDAVESLLDTVELQRAAILKLKGESNDKSKNENLFK